MAKPRKQAELQRPPLIDTDTLTATADGISGSLDDGTPFAVKADDPLRMMMTVLGVREATRIKGARTVAPDGGRARGKQQKTEAAPGLRDLRARYLQMKARNPRLGEQVAADRLGTSRKRLRKAFGKAP
jgi:hypothetical protein